MDARAPAVVAVVVTADPGPWLESSLASLAAQDYRELSVLVMVAGSDADPTARVAAAFPDAFVRSVPAGGFGGAANQVLDVVEGAAFFLLCHDDCALDPDALRTMVQESYRSNAGIVSPKMVRWEEPEVLLHVGMNVDKTGAVAERIQPGEIDHGQHDGVRDVFMAPGGCVLVRADLFEELGGYDPTIPAMAEDLDLCWRAQLAGARVVVAPDARVRHLEVVAGGVRALPASAAGADGHGVPTLQDLERRHELRIVLKCYGPFHLARVLPQMAALAMAEVVVALAQRDTGRARAVARAWAWNLRHLGDLRRSRRAAQGRRRLPDAEVRRLQAPGSLRLSSYLSHLAHAEPAGARASEERRWPGLDPLGHGNGDVEPGLAMETAFSEDADFDQLDDWGLRSRVRRGGFLATRRARLAAVLLAAAILLIGTRGLLGARLPLVGQFATMLSWTGTWHRFFAGWQPAGVGTTAPATPAFAVLGIVGTVTLGGMGLAQKVLVLGAVPLGAWGVSRLLRPLASPRARLVAALCYLGLPLPYDAIARGRWDGLVAYAATPWLLALVARASALAPFGAEDGARSRRRGLVGRVAALAVVESVAVAFAPAVALVVLLCGLGILVGSLLVGGVGAAARGLGVAAAATVGTAVLCLPWVVGILSAGRSAGSVLGLSGTGGVLSFGQVLRFDVGPTGGSPLSWLLVVAAVLPLLVGRGERLAWAGRLWILACLAWILAWAVARRWTGAVDPSVDVLLAPAATAVAACIGLGVSAFEHDLSGFRFGWRQLASTLMGAAAVVGLAPVVAEAGDGRWGLAPSGYEGPLSYLGGATADGAYRVLWLGNPGALPLGGWSVGPGFAYATSEDGLPNANDLWAPASPGPAAQLAGDVQLAMRGETVMLGQLLAPAAVRYVVVLGTFAPSVLGLQSSPPLPAPADLLDDLYAQEDLREIPGGEGFTVFENTDALPERAQHRGDPLSVVAARRGAAASAGIGTDALSGWRPALSGTAGALSYVGTVGSGTVFASYAPGGSWRLSQGGRILADAPAFGWAVQYSNVAAGEVSLRFEGSPLDQLGAGLEVALWPLVAATLLGQPTISGWWRRRRGTDPGRDGAR